MTTTLLTKDFTKFGIITRLKLWMRWAIGFPNPEVEYYRKHHLLMRQIRRLQFQALLVRTNEVLPNMGLLLLDVYTLSWYMRGMLSYVQKPEFSSALIELIIEAGSNDQQKLIHSQFQREAIVEIAQQRPELDLQRWAESQLAIYQGSFEERFLARQNRIFNTLIDFGRLLAFPFHPVLKLFSPALDIDDPPTKDFDLGPVAGEKLAEPFQKLAQLLASVELDPHLYEGILTVAALAHMNPPQREILDRAVKAVQELKGHDYVRLVAAAVSRNPFFNPIGSPSHRLATSDYFVQLRDRVHQIICAVKESRIRAGEFVP